MSPGILGKKIGMTQVFRARRSGGAGNGVEGRSVRVTQRKTPATDGYDAIQIGFVEFVKPQRLNKPMTGHLKKAGAEGVEFHERVAARTGDGDFKPGDRILVEEFKPKEKVDVIGVSKGRGFAGFVKRHHFRGGDASHGSMFHRAPGSSAHRAFRPVFSPACVRPVTWATRGNRAEP